MFTSDRDEYRKVFFAAWHKYKEQQLLEPLEAQLVEIILLHPEYQALLDDPENNQTKDFDVMNPFLHMSLHLGIREQITMDRPAGIKQIYADLCHKIGDKHIVEHNMMEYLAKILWDAQQSGKMPDEVEYLEGLKKLI